MDSCLSFFFWPLCFLSFDLRILVTPLESSYSFLLLLSITLYVPSVIRLDMQIFVRAWFYIRYEVTEKVS